MATEYVESIQREAPEIEARKVALMDEAKRLYGTPLALPEYGVAGLSPTTTRAIDLATQGVGAYKPYLEAGGAGIAQGQNLAQAGARGIASINVAPEFAQAQSAQQQGLAMAGQLPSYAAAAGLGYGSVQQGMNTVGGAINQAAQYSQANLAPSQNLLQQAAAQTNAAVPNFSQAQQTIAGGLASGQQAVGMAAQAPGMAGFGQGIGAGYSAAQQAQQAAAQPGFGQGVQTALTAAQQAQQATAQPGFGTGQQAIAGGIGALTGSAQRFDPNSTQAFMNPYQQQVIDESIRQINRQGDIAKQGAAAQAVRAGAFGGTREGVQRAEMERALSEQRNAAIVGGLQQGYGQAQQAALTSFEQQQQRQLAAGQGLGSLGTQAGQIAATQAGLGQQAAQQLAQAGQLQAATAGQAGQLGLAAAQQYGQAAQLQTTTTAQQAALQQQAAQMAAQQGALGLQAGQALGGLEAQRTQLGLAGAGQLAGIGSTYGQQAMQQAQLGQSGAQLAGSLGSQQAQMGLLPAQIASQQAAIAGQGAQLYGQLGQGIGSLAAQEAGIGMQQGSTLGQLGATIGQLGVQQGALGQAAQGMQMADVSALTQLGGLQQQNEQARLEAERATRLQETMAPYQQLGFMSDIYRGAPSTSSTLTAQSAPSVAPAVQAVGLATSGLTAAAGAQKLFG